MIIISRNILFAKRLIPVLNTHKKSYLTHLGEWPFLNSIKKQKLSRLIIAVSLGYERRKIRDRDP
jgi:hypothetical protein